MSENRKSLLSLATGLLIANLLLSLLTYPILPDRVILHWGAGGTPDGFGGKLTGVLLMQLIQFMMYGIYVVIPRIDPRHNITQSTGYYRNIMNLMMAYFLFFNILFITQNLGYNYNMTSALIPGVGILLYLLGEFMGKAEPNWFIGLRTPWTLSNDEVWRLTHQRAGVLFKLMAAVSLVVLVSPINGIWIFVGTIFLSSIYLIVFSYTEYRRLEG